MDDFFSKQFWIGKANLTAALSLNQAKQPKSLRQSGVRRIAVWQRSILLKV